MYKYVYCILYICRFDELTCYVGLCLFCIVLATARLKLIKTIFFFSTTTTLNTPLDYISNVHNFYGSKLDPNTTFWAIMELRILSIL